VDWNLSPEQQGLLDFTAAVIQLRKQHPVLRRRRFFAGDAAHGGQSELGDIEWFKPDASPMDDADWNSGFARSLMVFLNGDAIPEPDDKGQRISDDHFLLMFNAHTDPVKFVVPPTEFGDSWRVRLDSATGLVDPADAMSWSAGSSHAVEANSMVVLSTTVVPTEERVAAEHRAAEASATVATQSAKPQGQLAAKAVGRGRG
jgi:isoamylase